MDGLELVVRQLSPHLLLTSTHKIVEYLIRIYDIHAHAKHAFIMAFLPYFETAYFMKAIQLVNVKDDEYFSFLHQFAYQGQAIDKKTLVKAFGRNQASLFSKYAQWCLEGSGSTEAAEERNGHQEGGNYNMHHKFLGVMMVEIIRNNR